MYVIPRCRYCGPELSSNWYNDAVKSSFNQNPEQRILQIPKMLMALWKSSNHAPTHRADILGRW